MIFKRRNKRPLWTTITESVLPRRGWRRAISYIGHRLRRLPDTAHNIAFGIAIGVWVCFTPLFGFHMLLAIGLALFFRANVVAALFGTLFGTPPTFVVIATINFKIGNWIFGTEDNQEYTQSTWLLFRGAFAELWGNFKAMFGSSTVDWTSIFDFFHAVFLPYLVGGIVPAFLTAGIVYWASKPLIIAYQTRRKGLLMARIRSRRTKAENGADGKG